MCKEGKEQDINRVGCIGQSSVGFGTLGEVITGQCRMEKSVTRKDKSTYNSFIWNQVNGFPPFVSYFQ